MPNYETKYLFSIEVDGAQAVAQAQQIRQQIAQALQGTGQINIGGVTGGTGATGFTQQVQAATKAAATASAKAVAQVNAAMATVVARQPANMLAGVAQALQQAEVQYFGLRRLSYGLQSVGRDMTQSAQQTYQAMSQMVSGYLVYAEAMTRAAMAMELPITMNDELTESVRQLSTELGKPTAAELLEGMRLLAAGTGQSVKSTEQLNAILKETAAVSQLASMNQEDLGQTMTHVGGILGEFSLPIEDINDVVKTLDFYAAKTWATVGGLGESLKFVGPIANEMGDSLESVIPVLADLAHSNIQASMSGRAIRQMYQSIIDPAPEAVKALNDLFQIQEKSGESWEDILKPGGQFVGLATYIDQLAAATANYTDAEKEQALAVISTTNEMPALLTMIDHMEQARARGFNYYRAMEKEQAGIIDAEVLAYADLRTAIDGTTYVIQNATDSWTQRLTMWMEGDAARMNNLKNRWQNTFDQMGAVIFSKAIGPLEDLGDAFEKLGDIVEGNPALVSFVAGTAALDFGVGTVLTQLGKLSQAVANVAIVFKIWPELIKASKLALLDLLPIFPLIGAAAYASFRGGQALSALVPQLSTAELEATLKSIKAAEATGAMGTFDTTALEAELARRKQLADEMQRLVDAMYPNPASYASDAAAWHDALQKQTMFESDAAMAHRKLREEMDRMAGLGLVTPEYARPDLTSAEITAYREKFDSIVKSYESHLKSMAQSKASFDLQEKRSDEAHQVDINQTRADRLSERADMFMDYAKQVLAAEKDFQRQEALALRDHQQSLADLEKDAQAQRLSQQIQFQRALADSERSYQQSVGDAYEQEAYNQTLAAEEALYSRAMMLRDYQRSEAAAAESYQYSQEQMAESFRRSEASAAEEYLYQRTKTIQDYQEQEAEQSLEAETQKNEKLAQLYHDYLQDIERQRLSHLDKMFDLVASRDARGLLNEVRDWRRYLGQRKEDYDEAVSETVKQAAEDTKARKEALADQLKDQEEAEARRKAQALAAYQLQLQDAAKAEERRRQQAQAAYVLQLQDFEESEDRREKLAKEAFDRQLALMKRAHEREIAELQRRHELEMSDLEDQIEARRVALEEDYQRQRDRAKEEQEYRLAQMKVEFDLKVKEFDYETHQMILKMNIRYAEEKELRRKHFEEELAQTEQFAKDELKAQLDGLTLPEAELNRIFMLRMRQLELYLGRELEFVTDYYNKVTAKMAAVSSAASIAMSDPDAAGSSAGVSSTAGGTAGGGTSGGGAVSTGGTVSTGAGIAGGGSANVGSQPVTSSAQIVPYQKLFEAAAKTSGIPWYNLAAQAAWESGFNPNAKSSAGALGIAQFMPGTWPTWGSGSSLDPKNAIPAMGSFMGWLMDYMSKKGRHPVWDWSLLGYLYGPAGATKRTSLSEFSGTQGELYLTKIKALASQFAAGKAWTGNWYGGKGLAAGGIVRQHGLYEMAEGNRPEAVIPLTRFGAPLSSIPQSGMVIQVNQKDWSFHGTFTEGDKQWFRGTAKQAAYEAVEEVVSNA